ncbi:MAG: 16S rRNA (uracil(1498)-N(3))-methyltransferase [Clostridiales bacterium]|nr:16S rRNA (uracil(1498)-N(3))-methyltransferase [Clostridiales bacterium]
MHQFFVEDSQIGKEYITITGGDVNHIKNVLRMRAGEKIRVSSESGQDYFCEIAEMTDDFVQADILDEEAPGTELSAKIYLFQALPKGDRMDYIVQKAVELGVYEIIPVAMQYCVVKLDEKRAEKKVKRWQVISESAAKQSKRSIIPKVRPVITYDDALAYANTCDVRLVPYENEKGMETTETALNRLKPGQSVSILIDPEGGFSADEIEEARTTMNAISLGRRILRTDTAAICALSAVMLRLESSETSQFNTF